MNKSARIVFIIFTIVLLSLTFICYFAYQMVTESLPKTNGRIDLTCIDKKVDVYRDKYSIPHIIAQNEYELFFTQGFITSQDRFWQMDIIKRTAQGRLSEIFGSSTIQHDKAIVRLGFKQRAKKIGSNLSSDARQALEAYVQGINCFIENSDLPIEFKLLYYTPEKWTVEDCICILQLWEWQMNRGWRPDIVKEFLLDTLGTGKFKKYVSDTKHARTLSDGKTFHFFKSLLKDCLPSSFPKLGFDCNTFMIPEDKSLTSTPLFSVIVNSNPVIPCLFYEMHLASKKTSMYGLTIPGIPGVIIGYNQNILWGVCRPENHNVQFRTIVNALSVPTLLIDNHTLEISPDSSLKMKSYQLDNRPLFPINKHMNSSSTKFVMIDWPGFTSHNLWETIYRLGKAEDGEDFDNAVHYSYPHSLGFFYADKTGKSKNYPEQKHNRNNSLHALSDKNFTTKSQLGAPYRTGQLLALQDSITIRDVKRIQSDVYSLYAENLKDKIISEIGSYTFKNKIEQDLWEKLTVWKGDMKVGSTEAVFFQTFMYTFFQNFFKNELSDSLVSLILSFNSLYYEMVYSVIDDICTENSDNSVLITSFKETIAYLKEKLGEDSEQWSWGDLHRVLLQNPMGNNPFLKSTYNLGPFAAGGSFHTIDAYTSNLSSLFSVQSIPAAKMIIDLHNQNISVAVLSTGQSGQPFDDHYRDQVELAMHNLYHTNMTDTSKLNSTGWDHLIIE